MALLHAVTSALAVVSQVEEPAIHDHWAVLVAGSSGYGNYRHQADVCHAYQIVKKAGIKPSQIIVLAADDIANNEENPFPGKLFNKPTAEGTPGKDVYEGCVIDYSGRAVTPANFVKVLTGDSSGMSEAGSGKVLASTSNSRVFVNFVDHGGVGLIGFPRTTMHATQLMAALNTMHTNQMYKELVFYLEACESGSMFQDLPANIQIYATSAANAKESSWGTYCPPNDKVDGTHVRSCLGDLYSVNWMEDSDSNLASGETLHAQFEAVKLLTNKSHVKEFGTLSISNGEPTSNFQGATDQATLLGKPVVRIAPQSSPASSHLRSADAELASAYARFMATESPTAAAELTQGVRDRVAAKERFHQIALAVLGRAIRGVQPERVDMACHYAAHKAYVAKCGEWTTGSLKHSADLAEMCAATEGDSRAIVAAINEACAHA